MPIVFEGGRRGGTASASGSSSFGRRGQCCAPAAGSGSSSSARRGSNSRAAVLQRDEVEESDGEVQSSYRGPFDTMDALQEALPNKRKGVFKFYNGKTNSVADVADAAQPAKDIANPVNPSPKKRKGFLLFGFSWSKSLSKGPSSRRDAPNSSKNCRKTLSPALTSGAQGNGRDGNEHQGCQDPDCHCLHRRPNTLGISASPPGTLRSQMISVQLQSVSVAGLEDVAESTISPREKRRKSLQ